MTHEQIPRIHLNVQSIPGGLGNGETELGLEERFVCPVNVPIVCISCLFFFLTFFVFLKIMRTKQQIALSGLLRSIHRMQSQLWNNVL